MKHFNLSAWAVSHPALILFLVVALGAAGFVHTPVAGLHKPAV